MKDGKSKNLSKHSQEKKRKEKKRKEKKREERKKKKEMWTTKERDQLCVNALKAESF